LKKLLILRKEQLCPKVEGQEAKWATGMVNLFNSLATNRPTKFGVYSQYAKDEIDELIAHYEDDLQETCGHLDEEGITRLSQVMYLLKTKKYENIWWRIENRVHDLAESGKLDAYHITNILRSFSKSQDNQMSGSPKLFVHLEPLVLEHLEEFSLRDLGHIAYAYSIRALGNPELHTALEKRLTELTTTDVLDYPSSSNLLYYLMFRDCKNETLWKSVIEATLENPDTLPIVYYKPFKLAKFYLQSHFPEWDLNGFTDRFWYSE